VGADQHSYKRFGIFVGYLYFNLKTNADSATLFPNPVTPITGNDSRLVGVDPPAVSPSGSLNLPEKLSLTSQFDASSGDPITWSPVWITTETGSLTTALRSPHSKAPALPNAFRPAQYHQREWIAGRNAGTMPTLIHLDTNLSRTFELHSHGLAADGTRALP